MQTAVVVLIAGFSFSMRCFSQDLGRPPASSLNSTDLYAAFRLPALRDRPGDPLKQSAVDLKVVMRAKSLYLTSHSAVEAWDRAQSMVQYRETAAAVSYAPPVIFNGSTTSELNRLIASANTHSICITSGNLKVDEPVQIGRIGLLLDFGSATLSPVGVYPYLIRLENALGVEVTGGIVATGESGVLISQSNRVVIRGMTFSGLKASGIVVTHSSEVLVRDNRLTGLRGAPVILHEGTYSSIVESNQILNNLGWPNMSAGIVITDRDVDVTSGPGPLFGPGGYWVVSQPMSQRMPPPHDNIISHNHLASNNSSGVYVDGGVAHVIVSNTIERNAKEGICLDNGSASNVVTWNLIQQNGQRWGEPDYVMTQEFIARSGRLQDGTAAAKVPGISIDNALYNLIYANTVSHNFGGGIKCVRTACLIGLNTMVSNNDGASANFHFFGIELGAAALDNASDELDATPSHGNILFSNVIRGIIIREFSSRQIPIRTTSSTTLLWTPAPGHSSLSSRCRTTH
jgi:hypothetical protein